MGQRTIYVREEHEPLWERAKELAGEESLSGIIADGLRYIIAHRESALERTTIPSQGASFPPKKGRIKRGEGALIGNAGEYAVMSELLKRGIIAGLTPRNTPGFDIMATANDYAAFLRVKTKTALTAGWQWNAHLETDDIFLNVQTHGDFVVLVNLGDREPVNEYFIIPTTQIDEWLKADFKSWLEAPSKDPGKPHSPTNQRRILRYADYADRLKPYKNWDILFN